MIKKFILLATITCSLFATSCTNDLAEQYEGDKPVDKEAKGIYILSAGNYNGNNASLSYYDFQKGELSSFKDGANTSYDYFFMKNNRKLGDTSNDLKQYGSKIYCAVSTSGTVEVLDANTGVSLKQIDFKNEKGVSRKPRRIAFYKNNAYICSFDGTLARIDTTTYKVDFINVGKDPDGICCTNNKLYISNSGGLSATPDNTVSVVDPVIFKEIKKIVVRNNPGNIDVDDKGNIYVVSRDKYDFTVGDYDYRLHLIDSKTDEVKETYNYKAYNFVISGHSLYMYSYKDKIIQVMDTYTGKMIKENFITDGTTITNPYCIEVEPHTGDVYVTDAGDFKLKINGLVICFDQSGKRKFTINAGGINPSALIFKK